MMKFLPLLLLFLFVPGVPFSSGAPKDSNTTVYSRAKILPLVSSPGRGKNLFAKYVHGKKCTWNKKFWGASLGFDQFTGIGWGTERAGVLITPEHVVSAAHYGNNPKYGVHFYGKDGSFLGHRAVAKGADGKVRVKRLAYDVQVALLESPAPKGARIYALPDPKGHDERAGWGDLPKDQRPLLLATDWRNPRPKKTKDPKERQRWRITRTAQPVRVLSTKGPIMSWRYGPNGDPAVHPSYHEVINKGDSAHPVFWITRSGLVLASTFGSPMSGPNYGHPEVQASIQEAIDALGGERKYKLKFAQVP